jgi:hypothetical protein
LPEESQAQTPLFPPEANEAVQGLLWLGHLERSISYGGHSFVIRTLKAAEELDAGLIAKDYEGSLGFVKANAWSQLAAAVTHIDGTSFDEICPPISHDSKHNLRGKFNYLTQNWYWPIAVRLFDEYTKLVGEQALAIEAIQDLSGPTLNSSWASSESWTGPESSTENPPNSI